MQFFIDVRHCTISVILKVAALAAKVPVKLVLGHVAMVLRLSFRLQVIWAKWNLVVSQ